MKRILTLCLLSAATLTAFAQATPYGWRGPEHNGNYPDKNLLTSWPAEGPALVFETLDAGKGYSTPLVVGDRILLTGMNEEETKEVLNCYDLTGKKLYAVEYGEHWTGGYPETRTTPAVADGKAYVVSGQGEVVCMYITKGSIISADGKLYCYDEKRGMVALVNPNPAKFDIISQFRITKGSGPYWAHMSIDKGILYLRHGELFAEYNLNK